MSLALIVFFGSNVLLIFFVRDVRNRVVSEGPELAHGMYLTYMWLMFEGGSPNKTYRPFCSPFNSSSSSNWPWCRCPLVATSQHNTLKIFWMGSQIRWTRTNRCRPVCLGLLPPKGRGCRVCSWNWRPRTWRGCPAWWWWRTATGRGGPPRGRCTASPLSSGGDTHTHTHTDTHTLRQNGGLLQFLPCSSFISVPHLISLLDFGWKTSTPTMHHQQASAGCLLL